MGFIKIDRALRDWQWYNTKHMINVWLEILLTVAFADYYQGGLLIKRGQVLVSRKKMSEKLNISEQEVRTCINRLVSTNEITTKKTNKGTLITVIKWEDFQSTQPRTNQQINQGFNQASTSNQPATNQRSTSNQPTLYIKEDKEVQESKEGKERPIDKLLTGTADEKLIEEMNCDELQEEMLKEENWIKNVNLIECWEEGFGAPPSSGIMMRLQDDVETYGIEKTYCALREAVMYGKRSIDYIDAILIAWKDMTPEQILDGERP